ncbi:collagen binding domain-containing protein [Geodermatophilus sp. SYSU D00691]
MNSGPRTHRPLARTPRSALLVALVLFAATVGTSSSALAAHGLATLTGSNFEIDENANLKLDHAPPSTDWGSLAHPDGPESRAPDAPTGRNDDSYQGGVKEDTACPGEVTGSIPNNKSDLLTFHVYEEPGTAPHPGFLNLAWSRVSDPSGTTLMDFEFNQSEENCAQGPNKVRTAGDLLIEYAIDQGGARANITGRFWTGTAWGPPQDLDNGTACGGGPCAVGTINSTAIPAADADGLGDKQPRTFGEAQIDLRLIFQADECVSFGSAMLKSRSSDSFTSQLKDFISPVDIDLQNCGNVIIRKETIPEEDPNTTEFGYTKTFPTAPASEDTFTLTDDGVQDYQDTVLFGAGYTVTEDVVPDNWAFDSVDCAASSGVAPTIDGATVTFDIDSDSDVLDCTYYNALQQGALKILKNSTKGGPVTQAGAVFSFDGSSVTDNGAGDLDPAIGIVCVEGVAPGDYTVNETTPPPGYGPAAESDLPVTVTNGTNCTDDQPSGAGVVTFVNAPLADIQVNVRDGGSGETSATSITCENTGTDPDGTTADGWEQSVTHSGIAVDPSPRTVVCTIVLDP